MIEIRKAGLLFVYSPLSSYRFSAYRLHPAGAGKPHSTAVPLPAVSYSPIGNVASLLSHSTTPKPSKAQEDTILVKKKKVLEGKKYLETSSPCCCLIIGREAIKNVPCLLSPSPISTLLRCRAIHSPACLLLYRVPFHHKPKAQNDRQKKKGVLL